MNKTSIKQLDKEFRTQVFMLGKTVENLKADDQDHVADWLNVLMNVTDSEEEARVRNDCTHYLLKGCINGELAAIFREMPSAAKLMVFPDLLPKNARSCTRCGKRVSKKTDRRKQPPKKHADGKKSH